MMRYSDIPTPARLKLRDKFNIWGNKTNSFVRPFQDDYTNIISPAINVAIDARIPIGLDAHDKTKAKRNLTPVVYGFENQDIQVYILPAGMDMAGHGMTDVAVLQLKNGPYSHVVLYGETMKQWLDRGVADFVIPAEDIGKELQDIMISWQKFSTDNLQESDQEPYGQILRKLSGMISLYNPVDFIKVYLYPVTSLNFDDPESYQDQIQKMLINSSSSLRQPTENSPSPYLKIRLFE